MTIWIVSVQLKIILKDCTIKEKPNSLDLKVLSYFQKTQEEGGVGG